jgi:hypothetical protein
MRGDGGAFPGPGIGFTDFELAFGLTVRLVIDPRLEFILAADLPESLLGNVERNTESVRFQRVTESKEGN